MSEIWFRDPSVLYDKEQLLQFIPDQSMSFPEQINAIMRFAIYFTVIVFFVKHDVRILYFPVFVGCITWLVYTVEEKREKDKMDVMERLAINQNPNNKRFCTKPTRNNPFMNVLMNEYKEFPSRPEACNVESGRTKRMMKTQFDTHAIRDVDDVFEKKSSDRQFYTVASTTIPNNQVEFANWLYALPPTCKENNVKCII